MSDGDLLLDAIRANPDEDTPRLLYADWLDEQGEHKRARFIRWQCRPNITHPIPVVQWRAWFNPWWQGETCRRTLHIDGPCHLLMKVRAVAGSEPTQQMYIQRGFVSQVRLPCAAFVALAANLFAQPVTRVVLTDRYAFGHTTKLFSLRSSASIGVDRSRAEVIPAELFFGTDDQAQFFESQDAARDWISDRCVAFGRAAFAKLRHKAVA